MCACHDSNGNGFGDIWWSEKLFYVSSILGGCPFNRPLSGTEYPTRAASPIQNASTPKSSLPFSKHRSCALLCAVVRCCALLCPVVRCCVQVLVELIFKIIIILLIIFLGFIKSKPC